MSERVGQAYVVLSDVFVIGDDVVGEPTVVIAINLGHLSGRCDLDVHVVRGASQHSVGGMGDDLQRLPAAHQVILGLRDDVGQGHRLSAGGRLEGHLLVEFRVVL